ncbi:SAM-dependent methyltransferase [Dactylosporangium aurantiacum]|uniref:SAM-dependent methyltransferase n=1 Tax=Dactylosporangium aurantiacum TaxID=35754 RepID=A0A9Q9INA7_9ACTN|nr:SAM-dependent methyltransferase [Dactylosporangium aurantiacum]MDG6100700.1 SAM-dependent methyltransferase [Dactylosporangium aurantiacum]UWZ59312.1 SAM-dependent methyltransferase [Dactylosporangium aurantiacum]
MSVRWRAAMQRALYGPDGFFRRPGPGPAAHFRTSAHASPLFAGAIATLLERLDDALDRPARLDLVDVGAGRGELLRGVLAALPPSVVARVAAVGVEVAPRPPELPARIGWATGIPSGITGLLVATEWLDNIPVEIVELDARSRPRYVCCAADGTETLDEAPLTPQDAAWLATWWPLEGLPEGARAEVGRPRDEAWAAAVGSVARGLALAVDYGHLRGARPLFGTLTGFRHGKETPPVPDGSCDLTVAVALDSLDVHHLLLTQREALRLLGVHGGRPPLAMASTDPAGYVRALARAGEGAELTDPAGLGGHHWVMRWV